MQFKESKVILIADTGLSMFGVEELLREVGNSNWSTDCQSSSEELVEIAGRLCYKSFAPGLNPNVTKVREGNRDYVGNVLKQHHGSVLEHASVTFAFLNVTRVFTHELVRHRAGVAISQESLRYVRLTDLGAYLPDCLDDDDEELMRDVFEHAEWVQKQLSDKYGLDDEASFNTKKKLTSAFRRMAPIGLTTNILVTANHRAWRHILEMRASPHAEEEIQKVMCEVAGILNSRYPSIYQDMEFAQDGTVTFGHSKV